MYSKEAVCLFLETPATTRRRVETPYFAEPRYERGLLAYGGIALRACYYCLPRRDRDAESAPQAPACSFWRSPAKANAAKRAFINRLAGAKGLVCSS